MEAIILSGFPAAGKTTVAGIIGNRLGVRVVGGGDILREMAVERGYKVTGADWWDTPDGIKFLRERETNSDFDKEADVRLIEKIRDGDIVVTSYTAPWLTKDDGFKVWLKGSTENRAKRMSKRDGTPLEETKNVIKIRDDENSRLYKALYNIDFGNDLRPFDLIVDTNKKTAEEVADIIIVKYKLRNGTNE